MGLQDATLPSLVHILLRTFSTLRQLIYILCTCCVVWPSHEAPPVSLVGRCGCNMQMIIMFTSPSGDIQHHPRRKSSICCKKCKGTTGSWLLSIALPHLHTYQNALVIALEYRYLPSNDWHLIPSRTNRVNTLAPCLS